VGWGDGFAEGDYIQHSYHWRDVLTHIVGSHSFKGGFEAWRSDDIALFAGAYDQPSFSFNNMIDLIANNPHSESGISYNPVTLAHTTLPTTATRRPPLAFLPRTPGRSIAS
jgi:hypothetical protein